MVSEGVHSARSEPNDPPGSSQVNAVGQESTLSDSQNSAFANGAVSNSSSWADTMDNQDIINFLEKKKAVVQEAQSNDSILEDPIEDSESDEYTTINQNTDGETDVGNQNLANETRNDSMEVDEELFGTNNSSSDSDDGTRKDESEDNQLSAKSTDSPLDYSILASQVVRFNYERKMELQRYNNANAPLDFQDKVNQNNAFILEGDHLSIYVGEILNKFNIDRYTLKQIFTDKLYNYVVETEQELSQNPNAENFENKFENPKYTIPNALKEEFNKYSKIRRTIGFAENAQSVVYNKQGLHLIFCPFEEEDYAGPNFQSIKSECIEFLEELVFQYQESNFQLQVLRQIPQFVIASLRVPATKRHKAAKLMKQFFLSENDKIIDMRAADPKTIDDQTQEYLYEEDFPIFFFILSLGGDKAPPARIDTTNIRDGLKQVSLKLLTTIKYCKYCKSKDHLRSSCSHVPECKLCGSKYHNARRCPQNSYKRFKDNQIGTIISNFNDSDTEDDESSSHNNSETNNLTTPNLSSKSQISSSSRTTNYNHNEGWSQQPIRTSSKHHLSDNSRHNPSASPSKRSNFRPINRPPPTPTTPQNPVVTDENPYGPLADHEDHHDY
ncbi:uncharacterized protein KGF55_004087 [Candida pseudojiufengensis]|uniref:uncharacterized protein n=1 Tax=Candida pseudojiufengensis TaxID=497109 RepID=UPI002224665E|nr:uncharacterized protein KGF55_004087 [Candida pseudojiufengensis]KAI5961162.1 hypothetical protein KGF55_004087 [Candida pseudojiufengensis]